MVARRAALAALALLLGCAPAPHDEDAAFDARTTRGDDAGAIDVRLDLADAMDAEPMDAEPPDAGADAGAITAAPDDRVITFRNECPSTDVTVGSTGGFVMDCTPDGSCPVGTACLSERTPPGCFWVLPPPERGVSALRPGESVTYVLRAPAIGGVRWSGNLYGRTDCVGLDCETGRCPGGVCGPGVGPVGPTTLAELTLQADGIDYYDVSMINGVNVPVSMGPDARGAYRAPPGAPGDAFWCGTGGGATASHSSLTSCSWTFDPTSIAGADRSALLTFVSPSDVACRSDADCAGAGVCGTAVLDGPPRAVQRCGRQLGWWTAHELCSATAGGLGAPIDCLAAVPGPGGGTRRDLFGCAGPYGLSCYSAGAVSTCCGCAVWPYPATETCHAQNPDWNAAVLPWVSFVKRGCPTAYSYQYDDPSSTFVCRTEGPINGTDYVVTFCPGGQRGF